MLNSVNHVGLFLFAGVIAFLTVVLYSIETMQIGSAVLLILVAVWMAWAGHDFKKPTRRRRKKNEEEESQ